MRSPTPSGAPVVIKIGSSSLASGDAAGLNAEAVTRVVGNVVNLWNHGHPTVMVTSGAVAAGLKPLGLDKRPDDIPGLQTAAAVGQSILMRRLSDEFGRQERVIGQILLTREVFDRREQYLNARAALNRMLHDGVVPIVNENDAVVVEELRFGDNDRLAAIVAQIIGAGLLIMLTDTRGLFSDDPNMSKEAQLLTAVRHTDRELTSLSGSGGRFGSGGVATKVAAAQMAAWSGIPTVVAYASEPEVGLRSVRGDDVGTWVAPRRVTIPARKLWIGFGMATGGSVSVDQGAVDAIVDGGKSLLAAGATAVDGGFEAGSAVEVVGPGGLVAKGISKMSANQIGAAVANPSSKLRGVAIHRDDLLILTDPHD